MREAVQAREAGGAAEEVVMIGGGNGDLHDDEDQVEHEEYRGGGPELPLYGRLVLVHDVEPPVVLEHEDDPGEVPYNIEVDEAGLVGDGDEEGSEAG